MSDGARFPWKIQKIVTRGPVADYSHLRDPMPSPPEGMKWSQDETREWKLVPIDGAIEDCSERNIDSSNNDEDWEVLSEKKAGSVRSLSSMESGGHQSNGSSRLSIPFKIQRTHSSSTIDSSDNAVGPSGKGVLGLDYVEHVILPTDTLQGICLRYKINSSKLKQANHFSGSTLLLAPKKLIIPISKKALRSGFIRVQDTDAKEYKIHAFQAEFPDLSLTEVKAYLELADWNLKDAMRSAKDDNEWEKEIDDVDALRSGQIHIKLQSGRFQAAGSGIHPRNKTTTGHSTPDCEGDDCVKPVVVTPKRQLPRVTTNEDMPGIATKTVKAQDVYQAATQHASYGVELQSLRQPLLADDATFT